VKFVKNAIPAARYVSFVIVVRTAPSRNVIMHGAALVYAGHAGTVAPFGSRVFAKLMR
jgi:hypothetical protein